MKPKRLISLLVAVCMMVTMLPVSALTAFAVDYPVVNNLKYNFNVANETAAVMGIGPDFKNTDDIVIPSTVEYKGTTYKVTEIGLSAFYNHPELTGNLIFAPNSNVTTINDYAFYGCSGLVGDLTLPESVTVVGNCAFRNCGGLNGILTLPSHATALSRMAFDGCKNLKGTLSLPDTLTTLGEYAFHDCSSLQGDVKIPDAIETIKEYTFYGCSGLTSVDLNNVTTIGLCSFYKSGLSGRLTIPYTVTTIEGNAFRDCVNLSGELIIPDSVTSIGGQAFSNCQNLEGEFKISETLQTLGQRAFEGAGITKIVLPSDFGSIQGIDFQNKILFYDGTRSDVENALSNNTRIQSLDKTDLKIGNNYICYYCDVTFDTDGGTPTSEAQTGILRTNKLDTSKIHTPSKEGYVFDGWYYEKDGQQVKFDPARNTVLDSMTLTAKWKQHATAVISGFDGTPIQQGEPKEFTVTVDPHDDTGNAVLDFGKDNGSIEYWDGSDWMQIPSNGLPIDLNNGEKDYLFRLVSVSDGSSQTLRVLIRRPGSELGGDDVSFDTVNKLTVEGGTVTVDGTPVELDADNSCTVKKDSLVEVTFDQSILADTEKFSQWMTGSAKVMSIIDPSAETIRFMMPAEPVSLTALTTSADDDSDPASGVISAVVVGTAAVGGAVLCYRLGTELWLNHHLPEWASIPNTRAELAKLLWQDAGQPAAASDVLYSDISADDANTQTAARWAVESSLIPMPDENDSTRFAPDAHVSRITIIKAWNKAQELKQSLTH